MHKFRIKTLAVSCGLALAGGCASLDPTGPAQFAVTPVTNVTHSAAITDANYQKGRSYQGRIQYGAAIAAYRKSLEANPGNAEAHNALGVIYATQGKHEQAVIELKAALALAPAAAHIHNNLGYTYLLQGRNADALAALKVASGLDPDNVRSRANMKIAEQRLGPEAPNAPTVQANVQPNVQASVQANVQPNVQANVQPNVQANVQPNVQVNVQPNVQQNVQPNVQAAAAVGAEVKSPPTDKDGGFSTARLLSVAPNIFELRQGSSLQIKPSLPLATETLATNTAPETVRLEVANGNGVTGLAKRTSSSLQRKGYAAARLTNQVPFTQRVTEIQYRQSQENQAKRLNALLSAPAKLVESSRLNPRIGVRLVLGRDAVKRSLFAETETPQFSSVKNDPGQS